MCIRASVLLCAVFTGCLLFSMHSEAAADVGLPKRKPAIDKVGTYQDVQAQGVRVEFGRPLLLDSVSIPVFCRRGDTAYVRVFGMERGAPAPTIEADLIEPIRVQADSDRHQTITVRFDPPIALRGNQAFVVVDRASPTLRPATLRDTLPPSCLCEREEFTQQVLRDSISWRTAPLRFPWKLGVRVDTTIPQLRFTADTVGVLKQRISLTHDTSSQSDRPNRDGPSPFYVATCDVNEDGRTDIITPSGVFLNRGGRVLEEVLSMSDLDGIGAISAFGEDDETIVYLIANATAKVSDRDVRGFSVVSTTLAVVRFSAIVVADNEPRVLAFGSGEHGRQQAVLLSPDDGRLLDAVNLSELGLVDLRSLVCTVDQAQVGQVLIVGHDNNVFKTVALTVVSDKINIERTMEMQPAADVIDIDGPGVCMASDDTLLHRHLTLAKSSQSDDIDRRSSVAIVDLDGDGLREILETTSDTCRAIVLVPMDSVGRQLPYIDLSMLWGSKDVAITDLDGNGTQDIVGYVSGRTTVLWNETPSIEPKQVRVPRTYRDEEIVAIGVHGTRVPVAMRGGVRGINIVSAEPFSRVAGIALQDVDSIYTSRNHAYDARDVLNADANASQSKSLTIAVSVQPNPLSSSAVLGVKGLETGQPIVIEITDMSARTVRTWRHMTDGTELNLSWDGADDEGRPLASGTYKVSVYCAETVCTTSLNIVH